MTELCEINFLEDESLQERLFRLSIVLLVVPVFVAGLYLGIRIIRADGVVDFAQGTLEGLPILLWLILLVLLTFASFAVHELIHASFFKLFCPSAHIIFGFKSCMLYAGCPGEIFTRNQMIWILLAPTVELSILYTICASTTGVPMLCLLLFAVHLSGCAGDILAAHIIEGERVCTHCQDTEVGIRLLGN